MKRLVDRFFAIRVPISRKQAVLLGLVPILVTLAAWFLVTRGDVESRRYGTLLPRPEEVAKSGWKMLSEPEESRNVYKAAAVSLWRVTKGFLIAALICLPIGIAMASFSRIGSLFEPIMIFSGYLPIAAIVPLTILWYGTDEPQKIAFLAIAGVCYLLPLVYRSITQVDEVFLQTAYTLGATKRHIVTKVLVPIASADLFDALRMSFAVGWTYIMLAEVVAAETGIGKLIQTAQGRSNRPDIVFFLLFVIVAIGFTIDKAFGWVGRQLFAWKYAR